MLCLFDVLLDVFSSSSCEASTIEWMFCKTNAVWWKKRGNEMLSAFYCLPSLSFGLSSCPSLFTSSLSFSWRLAAPIQAPKCPARHVGSIGLAYRVCPCMSVYVTALVLSLLCENAMGRHLSRLCQVTCGYKKCNEWMALTMNERNWYRRVVGETCVLVFSLADLNGTYM